MKFLVILVFVSLLCIGCQRGDLRVTPVIAGQPAPHNGYNIGPELYLLEGQPAKVTGAVIWINGISPGELTASEKMAVPK